jgi:histidinol phosphatase-like PHP family hydrolase
MKRPASEPLRNQDIAELLAVQAESAKPPVQKALRRASRRAFLWDEEAAEIVREGRALTELTAVGPYVEKIIRGWMAAPPEIPELPGIRKHFLTVPQARETLASKPSWLRELRGDLQMHSVWSDGTGSIAEMAEEADKRGYEYIAVTDHAKGLKIAGGINEEKLAEQATEIAAVNRALKSSGSRMRVLRSIELNLNVAGEGDLEPAALAKLDIVLGCFHSALRKKEDQTPRYLAALRNPDLQILGHPRGRIYNYRLGLGADWARVFGVAAELDKAVEIDSYPDRQDLSGDLLQLAKAAGCRISLGTDAHGPSQLRFIEFGLAAAARAGIKRERILNFMPREKLLQWVASVRDAARH